MNKTLDSIQNPQKHLSKSQDPFIKKSPQSAANSASKHKHKHSIKQLNDQRGLNNNLESQNSHKFSQSNDIDNAQSSLYQPVLSNYDLQTPVRQQKLLRNNSNESQKQLQNNSNKASAQKNSNKLVNLKQNATQANTINNINNSSTSQLNQNIKTFHNKSSPKTEVLNLQQSQTINLMSSQYSNKIPLKKNNQGSAFKNQSYMKQGQGMKKNFEIGNFTYYEDRSRQNTSNVLNQSYSESNAYEQNQQSNYNNLIF